MYATPRLQLARNACKLSSRLGRLCQPSDYHPFHSTLPFKTCSERAWRGALAEPASPFLLDPPFDAQRPGGHLSELKATRAAALDGSIAVDCVREMPSVVLKTFYKTRSTNPSYEERKRLATELLGADSEDKLALIDR